MLKKQYVSGYENSLSMYIKKIVTFSSTVMTKINAWLPLGLNFDLTMLKSTSISYFFLPLKFQNNIPGLFVLLLNKRYCPFPLSQTSSKACFDLIHMDIWGPFRTPTIHGHQYFLTIVDDHR